MYRTQREPLTGVPLSAVHELRRRQDRPYKARRALLDARDRAGIRLDGGLRSGGGAVGSMAGIAAVRSSRSKHGGSCPAASPTMLARVKLVLAVPSGLATF